MTAWVLPLLVGTATGILSAWGVGGGTLLLLVMTLFLGVNQRTAQGINLLFFLPTAASALVCHWRGGYLTKEVLKELLEEIERAGREKNKQPQISLNWAQAVLRVEYQELPEGMIRETKVVMEDANEGER